MRNSVLGLVLFHAFFALGAKTDGFSLYDFSGTILSEYRMKISGDDIRLVLTNRSFVLDGSASGHFRKKRPLTVVLNGRTVHAGVLPPQGRLFFLNSVTSRRDGRFVLPLPEDDGPVPDSLAESPVSNPEKTTEDLNLMPINPVEILAEVGAEDRVGSGILPASGTLPVPEEIPAETGMEHKGEGEPVRVRETADRFFVSIPDVLFAKNQVRLSREAVKILEDMEPWLTATAGPVVVRGYTDDTGTDSYNLILSRKRADAVAECLIRKAGVGKARFLVVGHGSQDPAADNSTPEGRARNRRVTIEVMK